MTEFKHRKKTLLAIIDRDDSATPADVVNDADFHGEQPALQAIVGNDTETSVSLDRYEDLEAQYNGVLSLLEGSQDENGDLKARIQTLTMDCQQHEEENFTLPLGETNRVNMEAIAALRRYGSHCGAFVVWTSLR